MLAGAAAWLATLAAHNFVAGAAVVIVAALLWRKLRPGVPLLSGPFAQWMWLLPLALALFLGIAPFEYDEQPVRGLYYYLHTYVPGFNGIRKVSRQAIVTTFCFVVLAGIGAGMVFDRLRWPLARYALFGALLIAVLLEFNTAPVTMIEVPAGNAVSRAYRYVARQDGDAPIGIVPGHWGKHRFTGQRGMALHNYLALYHGRRTLNGKSSWIPPITHVYHRAARRLPSEAAIRVLQILAPEFLVLHGADLDRKQFAQVLAGLDQRPDAFRRLFGQDNDYVYRVLRPNDPTLGLLPTPRIPPALERVPTKLVGMLAGRSARRAYHALDGNPRTRWATFRSQLAGDWVEFVLREPREIAALEFTDFEECFDSPLAFRIEVSDDGATYRTVFTRPRLRIFANQVHHPTGFAFRVVLDQPVRTRHVRMTLLEGVPGRWWSIYEAKLWERAPGAGSARGASASSTVTTAAGG